MSDELKPEKLAHVAGEMLRIAKDSPDARKAGNNFAASVLTVTELLENVLLPVKAINYGLGRAKEYMATKFGPELAEKTSGIPDEFLIEPKASVVGPALQSMAFTLDEKPLKDMYLSLIAAAMDGRDPDAAHPAFAEIIRQLSTPEAIALPAFLLADGVAVVEVRIQAPDGTEYFVPLQHLAETVDAAGRPFENERFPAWVDNWVRLGLVEVSYSKSLAEKDAYAWVESQVAYDNLLKNRPSDAEEGWTQTFVKGSLQTTAWGTAFAAATGLASLPDVQH